MRAKIMNEKIVWVDLPEEYLNYEAFLQMKCANPRTSDEYLGAYYEHYFGILVKLWEAKGKQEFSSASIFGEPRADFIELLNSYIQAREEEDHFFLEVLLCDWTRFIQERNCCNTRYDIFVEFIREMEKVLK